MQASGNSTNVVSRKRQLHRQIAADGAGAKNANFHVKPGFPRWLTKWRKFCAFPPRFGKTGWRRALSPTFRAGAMVFFIPWRVVAEESGAAH
jgi:hypothetical protein